MSNFQDFVILYDDFIGRSVLSGPWNLVETTPLGTPVVLMNSVANSVGELQLGFDSTNEAQNICLHFGDRLSFDIDQIQLIDIRLKTSGVLDSATTITFGVGSARNNDPDLVATNAYFKLDGSNSVVVETDDGLRDIDDVSTGVTLVDTHKRFTIDFTAGKENVKFYIEGSRVAKDRIFNMNNYSGSLQPLIQIQKTADTNVDSIFIDYVRIQSKR